MRDGQASATAQRVAALRLTFDREPAPYGDPQADDRLQRDVASATPSASPMGAYLQARTTFMDRVVVAALERGVEQVVIAAAGYDGRAWRYSKPGVRWFEVDHPATQADKRERVERLGLDTAHVVFVAADFAVDDVAGGLRAAGFDGGRPALFLVEGVAVYLPLDVLASLLSALRSVAALASRLAISLSVDQGTATERVRRARFARRVAAVGEEARTVLTVAGAAALFSDTGWAPVEGGSDRARQAGLVVVAPVTAGGRGAGSAGGQAEGPST